MWTTRKPSDAMCVDGCICMCADPFLFADALVCALIYSAKLVEQPFKEWLLSARSHCLERPMDGERGTEWVDPRNFHVKVFGFCLFARRTAEVGRVAKNCTQCDSNMTQVKVNVVSELITWVKVKSTKSDKYYSTTVSAD